MSLGQMFRVMGMQKLADGEGGSAITSSSPTLDLDPEYGVGTTGSRKLTASLKQGFQLASKLNPGTQDFWFAGWVKLASTSSVQTLLVTGANADGNAGFWVASSSGKVRVMLNDSVNATRLDQTFDTTLSTSTWYFLVVTFERDGVCTVYIDGTAESTTLDISGQQATLDASLSQPFVGYYTSGLYTFDGSLSRLLYGEGSLPTEAEIQQLYNGGQGLTYAELPASIEAKVTHAWNCMEASDGTGPVPLYDAKGTNDGTEVWA